MKKMPKPITIDFETKGILGRPDYPPEPVGVSIKYWGRSARYYAWGHPTENNCTKEEAYCALQDAIHDAKADADEKGNPITPCGVLFQNGKFDIDVMEVHFPKLQKFEWAEIHDTMFLLYLHNPHATTFSLKPSCEAILGMAPDEQDAVCDWLIANQHTIPPEELEKYGDKKIGKKNFGAYIAWAPGNLVGKYANGDTKRTELLFKKLYPSIVERGMLEAYNTERELMPIMLAIERQGIRVDCERLGKDILMYQHTLEKIKAYVCKVLKVPDLNLDSPDKFAAALINAGKADPDLLGRTKTGKLQTNKKALDKGVSDRPLFGLLKYYTQLSTCVNTFMIPWHRVALKTGGLIHTNWNQIKSTESGHATGTKTGRLSSNPSFMNIPKEFDPIFKHQVDAAQQKKLKLPAVPKCFENLPDLPMVRGYIIPYDKGGVIIDRDYSQQEPRILAHFDGGALLDSYVANPWIDFHDFAKEELEKKGLFYERKPVKNTNLGLIYGMGAPKLAERNDMTVEDSRDLKNAVKALYPGLDDMYKDMKKRSKENQPIRTWGGREYYCEEPKLIEGRMMHFDYKMVNCLIQGSAADCTKRAIINYWKAKPKNHRLLLTVHDQIIASVPGDQKNLRLGMKILKQAMESVCFDVPMLTEGDITYTNWADLTTYDKKGVQKYGN